MINFIEDLKLDIIATYNGHDQEWFHCAVTQDALENETTLLDYIKGQLSHSDLTKLSLCWITDHDEILEHPVIQESINKNAKYYFN
jgi:hypothetical protein